MNKSLLEPSDSNILIVDDEPAGVRFLSSVLKNEGYTVRIALNGHAALATLTTKLPDLILLDITMPDMSGFEVCQRLKASEQYKEIPVIFLSGLEKTVDKVKGFQVGGLDYITKPFAPEEVLARVKTHLSLRIMQRRLEKQNVQLREASELLERRVQERTEALREQQKLLETVFDSTPDLYMLKDENGIYRSVNTAFCEFLGKPKQEIIGKTDYDLFPTEEAEKYIIEDKAVMKGGRQQKEEWKVMGASGIQWLKVVKTAVLNENGIGTGILCSVTNISELKETEQALVTAKEIAESANRAKSEFIANMSHEIRTPMNAVIGFSDILAAEVTDKKQKSHLNSIQTAGKSLLTLINDILDLSKIEAGRLDIQYEPINPRIIFTELQQVFSQSMAENNLKFIVDIDETLPPALFLDETRLRQVLFNLIGNAIKFTERGYVKLCVKNVYTKDSYIDLIIAVEDSGIGIPTEQQALIFESFKQQDGQSTRKYGGTGLGLAITKRLVEMMNGQISVKSNPGKGSRFEIALHDVKVAVAMPAAVQDNSFDSNNIIFEKVLILVVDDIESNRNLIKEYLSRVNFEVVSAENGQEALLFVEEYHPALILMDIRMPKMDGYEATKRLKDNPNTVEIPVIALTF
jgi:PAS domain S-box-containing protein